jgi:hypothetical protein
MINPDFAAQAHSMTRLDIPTGIPFDEFRAAFESAVPRPDGPAILQIVAHNGDWDDVRAQAAANAPYGLMIYATIDATSLAGHRAKAVGYLLGNHVVAERMFRHDAKAMLYAPLRVLIHSDAEDNAVFSIDQPSSAFGSLGIPDISVVGEELDHKVAALLQAIGVDAHAAFAIQNHEQEARPAND